MSFKKFYEQAQIELNEVLNSKVDYSIVERDGEKFVTSALIGDRRIRFTAEMDNADDDLWDVYFYQTTPAGQSMSFDATGSGNELEVFSMVRASMEEFIRGYDPKQMKLTASKLGGSSRANLYDRMMRKFASNRYDVERRVDHNEDVFILTRKD